MEIKKDGGVSAGGGGVVHCQSCRGNQVSRDFLQTSQLNPNNPEQSGLKDFGLFFKRRPDWLEWIRNTTADVNSGL